MAPYMHFLFILLLKSISFSLRDISLWDLGWFNEPSCHDNLIPSFFLSHETESSFFSSPFFPPHHFNINAARQALRAKPIPSWNHFLFRSALNTELAAWFDTAGSVYNCTNPNCEVRVITPLWMSNYIPKAAIIVSAKQVKTPLMWNTCVFHLCSSSHSCGVCRSRLDFWMIIELCLCSDVSSILLPAVS